MTFSYTIIFKLTIGRSLFFQTTMFFEKKIINTTKTIVGTSHRSNILRSFLFLFQ